MFPESAKCVGAVRWTSALAGVIVCLSLAPATARAVGVGTNGKIVFASNRDTGDVRFHLYSMNPDGSGVTRLTEDAGSDRTPSWSPDGQKVAFASDRDDPNLATCGNPPCKYDIYVMNADGSGQTRLTSAGSNTHPTWSPDGRRIMFASDRDDPNAGKCGGFVSPPCNSDIFVMNADGSDQTTAIGGSPDDSMPAWSSDGQKVVFGGIVAPSGDEMFRANPDGSERTYVDTRSRFGGPGGFAWAPDSITVAYTTLSAGDPARLDVYKTNDDSGDTITKLTNETAEPEGNNRLGDWSPDGEKIVFDSNRGSSWDMYIMNADGTGPTRLTADAAEDREASWQPVQPGPARPGYPRPKGATPLQTALVIAYRSCSSPDRVHGPPLTALSCTAPSQSSDYLTVGTLDSNGQPAKFAGYVRMDVHQGNAATPENEADVLIKTTLTDIRCKTTSTPCPGGALSDYTGSLGGTFDLRITDRFNTGPDPEPATVSDLSTFTSPLQAPIPCTATADATVGATCELSTTLNALLPSVIRERKRSIWQLGQVQVKDGGEDGNGGTADDNTPFAVEGVFVP